MRCCAVATCQHAILLSQYHAASTARDDLYRGILEAMPTSASASASASAGPSMGMVMGTGAGAGAKGVDTILAIERQQLANMQEQRKRWQRREIGNFEYLSFLNRYLSVRHK